MPSFGLNLFTYSLPKLVLAVSKRVQVTFKRVLTLCVLACVATSVQAQLRVDISGTGAQQYPAAIADFSGDPAGRMIAEVIRADLRGRRLGGGVALLGLSLERVIAAKGAAAGEGNSGQRSRDFMIVTM